MEETNRTLEALLSGDDALAEIAARQLAAHGRAAISVLKELIHRPLAEVRWWAVRALAEIPDDEVVPLLIQALKDEDLAVRQCAALGLQLHPDERAVPTLMEALEDNDPLLVRLAGNALAAIGTSVTPALLEKLDQSPPRAKLEMVRALALIGDQRSIPTLFEALESDSMLIEYWANEGLERMGVGMVFFDPNS